MKKVIIAILSVTVAASLMSCAGATRQQKGTATGAVIGGAAGAGLGQAIGHDTESTLIGAGIGALVGALAGNQIGAYMDRQEQELRDAMAYNEATSIQRTGDVLTATFQSEVFFDFDSASLKPGAYTEIDRVANVLKKYPQTTIRVEGHTDSTGSEVYNQGLSERRAQAVKAALVQRGLDPARIQPVGFGESQPISSDNATNRRVNVVIIPVT